MPDACFSDVARRYGIAERVLFRWKREAEPGSRAGVRRRADHRCERAF
jgi:transposase-like protein